MPKKENIEVKINEVLEKIRPYLNSDGGDIEFIKFEEGVVFVRLIGACGHCPHRNQTIQGGVLAALQDEIPEVKEIINVEL